MVEADRHISVRNVFTDVDNPLCITVLYCKDQGKNILLFGMSDCELGHYGLLELAQDPDFSEDNAISSEAEIVGGALLDYRTLNKIRDSHAFGAIEDDVLDELVERIDETRTRIKNIRSRSR